MTINQKFFSQSLDCKFSFEKKAKIAVGVSGGPDSMALVYLLNKWVIKSKGCLTALIFDHRMRQESYKESIIIKKYLEDININSLIIRASKGSLIKFNMNEARINRFNGLRNYCQNHNILHLFLAHHYDDNLETFIIRRVSGSNLEGLASIKDYSFIDKLQLIRPLLNYTKKEIISFNNENKIFYLEDPSNYDLKYTRVAIRKFINTTNKIKYIKRDFRNLSRDVESYKKMIWEIFHTFVKKVNFNFIHVHYNNFIKEDSLIIEKQLQNIYLFFFKHKPGLRSAKIQKFIKELKEKSFLYYNIGGLMVKKNAGLLIFSRKKS